MSADGDRVPASTPPGHGWGVTASGDKLHIVDFDTDSMLARGNEDPDKLLCGPTGDFEWPQPADVEDADADDICQGCLDYLDRHRETLYEVHGDGKPVATDGGQVQSAEDEIQFYHDCPSCGEIITAGGCCDGCGWSVAPNDQHPDDSVAFRESFQCGPSLYGLLRVAAIRHLAANEPRDSNLDRHIGLDTLQLRKFLFEDGVVSFHATHPHVTLEGEGGDAA